MAANLKAIMFCEFHPVAGPKIAYQVIFAFFYFWESSMQS